YLGGSGAVIIGGLYWSRATAQGAWAALTNGWVVAVAGMGMQVFWPESFEWMAAHLPTWVPVSGTGAELVAFVTSFAVFIVITLTTCTRPVIMDQLLHCGDNADDSTVDAPVPGIRAVGAT